jgi:hypothetical protein
VNAFKHIRWDYIETLWMEGRLSNVAIAKSHEEKYQVRVSESAIRNRAIKAGWTRDISHAVRCETRRKLAEGAIPKEVIEATQGDATASREYKREAISEAKAIESAADLAVRIVESHRRHAENLHDIANRLEIYVRSAMPLDASGNPAAQYDVSELKDLSSSVSNVASTRRTAVEIERKAYQLDDPDAGGVGKGTLEMLRAYLTDGD